MLPKNLHSRSRKTKASKNGISGLVHHGSSIANSNYRLDLILLF